MFIAYLGNLSGAPTFDGSGWLLLGFAQNVTKNVKKENFDIFDNFGVDLRNVYNTKLLMSFLKSLLDIEFSRC